ncbi:MAG TPA: TetR family transcriptional regulator [Nocardioidaceae bacterium]|nr:TetR family transcriptional regulator [Nocardioidaceae bacterium]
MAAETRAASPRRGTRPANRRELILSASRDLLVSRGYDHIGVGDIADAVAIGPSALYRHFHGKQQILSEVLRREFVLVTKRMDEDERRVAAGDVDLAVRVLARFAIDFRGLGVLVQREARHLPEPDRDEVRDGVRTLGIGVGRVIGRARPDLSPQTTDLLAWTIVGILGSPSFHQIEVPRPSLERVLRDQVRTVLESPLPASLGEASPPAEKRTPIRPRSRREHLLAEAVRLFADRGYANVAVEDVGSAAGIAGPSVYNHFPSKLDLLVIPMMRGTGALMMELAHAFDFGDGPRDVLRRLIRSYVAFAADQHQLLDLIISEVRQLPDDVRTDVRRAQREYLQEWAALLQQLEPTVGTNVARIRVQAAVSLVNDIVRTPHLRALPGITAQLESFCTRLLLPQTQ